MSSREDSRRPLGIIGGSGLYSLIEGAEQVQVDTPFGEPSDPPETGTFGGRPVVFMPRHGRDHRFAPHLVNYRANLWALRALGVRQVLAPGAVGALRPDLAVGSLVVPDQLVDRTWGRAHTLFDSAGPVGHVTFADPYCPIGRATVAALPASPMPVVDGGTMVVIQGPRFSTRAESRRNAADGGDVVGMTGMPEAGIARELAMCYTSLAVVTDADAGVDHNGAVSQQLVLAAFARSIERLQVLLDLVARALPGSDDCPCRHALDGFLLPFSLP